MPNHVKQRLTIVGPDEDVRAFVDIAHAVQPRTGDKEGSFNFRKEDPPDPLSLSFHAIVPLPAKYHELSYNDYGFQAERDTWGVKWGAYSEEEPEVSRGRATYGFTCAWGPPRLWLYKASKRFTPLDFFLSFGGEGPIAGRLRIRDGEFLLKDLPAYSEDDYPKTEDFPNDPDEEAYYEAYCVARNRYITSHDSWVDSEIS